MIKPDWDVFKSKFSENPQKNFEWFCYLLFCKEFERPYGIFRYINQSGMETNPIRKKVGNECVAWEAKFYNDSLSKHKNDFIDKLKIAKENYPELNEMHFYTHNDWGNQTRKGAKNKPKVQIEIEKYAKSQGIKIIWKGASFFESPFVSEQNEIIARHFFSIGKDVVSLIEAQQKHSNIILNDIHQFILFNDQVIQIERSKYLNYLISNSNRVLLLSGAGGVGKTALMKSFYESVKGKIPFYIFKANEFESRNINHLFLDSTLQDFIEVHKENKDKIIVIDSAERLLEIDSNYFKEFIYLLNQNEWKLILTLRDTYLEDIIREFFGNYEINPAHIHLENIELKMLDEISNQYHFLLPKDEKLLNLITNPFYLNEYLKFYCDNKELNYRDFKNNLWNNTIKKNTPAREICFLKIAFERANKGQFFVEPDCDYHILDDELRKDGVLGYESPHGYFITHDIYEEWALERNIEREYFSTRNKKLFDKIGQSLPIRRSFRKWVSEKLSVGDNLIKEFIEEIIEDNEIESFWKDEILVSILLSDYSEFFFKTFKDELLSNNQQFLKKTVSLLKVACKEVDDNAIKQLGIDLNLFSLKGVLTKPKGQGWKSLIKFVHDNLDEIGIKNVFFILPLIHDWNSKFKNGETTRFSSLIALKCYQCIVKEDTYYSDTKKLLQTILYGSFEIKNELKEILEEIIKKQWKCHGDPYYELSESILGTLEGIYVCKNLPNTVINMADLFWSSCPVINNDSNFELHFGVEQDYGIEEKYSEFFSSRYCQELIYFLLKFSFKETIDFILKFTNEKVEFYAKSNLAKDNIKEVEIYVKENVSFKQYISDNIWNIYIGGGRKTVPYLLRSMHMALEEFFVENGKDIDSVTLESCLFYLIKNSKSASISAVAISVVLAYPEKTFDFAKFLFKTKEFIIYDTDRAVYDQMRNNCLSEKNKHRKWNLEVLFLMYQYIRNKGTSIEEMNRRKKELWNILDNYYNNLPNELSETNSDKDWRLFLARMDNRKMNLTTKETTGGFLIDFNPEIEPSLDEYRKKSIEKQSEAMKYSQLKFWAQYKMQRDDRYKQYKQYENNPQIAFKEAKEILSELNKDEIFFSLNYSTPSDVFSVLVRDNFEMLSRNEQIICKDHILKIASLSVNMDYRHQISDGVKSAFSVILKLLSEFPEERAKIKLILLYTLFKKHSFNITKIDPNEYCNIAFQELWVSNFDDAQSLLLGYLILKPKYNILRRIKENNNSNFDHACKIGNTFYYLEDDPDLHRVIENKISYDELKNLNQLDLYILNVAFQLIPLKTDKIEYKKLTRKIVSVVTDKINFFEKNNKNDDHILYDFLDKYAYIVLSSPKEEIKTLLEPFIDKFTNSKIYPELFNKFIYAENKLKTYENFWEVWNLFRPRVIELCKDGENQRYIDKILQSYLFAGVIILDNVTEWHALKAEDKRFLRRISEKLGHCPSVLFSISKLLNGIGSVYLNDGVSWISKILQNNNVSNIIQSNKNLEDTTIYYLENLSKNYIYRNREEIRKNSISKDEILKILDFLIEKMSVIGYLLREKIL